MKHRILAFLLLICMLFSFASCTSDHNDVPDSVPLDIISNGESRFVIIRPDNNDRKVEIDAAVKLNSAFRAASGSSLEIATDWERGGTVYEYEICVGDVSRNGKYYEVDASSLAENEYIIKVCGNRIVLLGKTPDGTAEAVDNFIFNFLKPTDGSLKSLAIPSDFSFTGNFEIPLTLRIMTQNLLSGDDEYKDCTTVDVSQHTVAKRQPRILSLIETYKPDSLGVQECSNAWRDYFRSSLDTIGYKRVYAQKNQKLGIFYNPETVKVVDSGSFWLTEKPESLKLTVEWAEGRTDLIERLGMYVVFEVIATGQMYIHFNTHVETPKNNDLQEKQVGVLLDYIEKLRASYSDIPVVVTGDFNFHPDSKPYNAVIKGGLVDTKTESASSSGKGSFNKFIGQSYADTPIDQIFADPNGWVFHSYKVLYDRFNGCYASDHYGIIADIEIKK